MIMKKTPTKTKKVTIDDLAAMMNKGFEGVNVKIDKEINDLAAMVANGFDSVHEEISEFKNDVDKRFNKVEKDIAEVKENLATTRMDVLGIGDKFVSKHEFSQHLVRFSLLEQKVKARK